MPEAQMPNSKYRMTISRLTVDKLGVKLYDKVSAVIAELVANSYDADATDVEVRAPMGELLATKQGDKLQDKGYSIELLDNGIGMTPDQVNKYYLRVGAERRNDPERGSTSKLLARRVMGRKGVGKLAPFGICRKIEIVSTGGDRTVGVDEYGKQAEGYMTAHLVLDGTKIIQDIDYDYEPEVGPFDGTIRQATGTLLKLSDFYHRIVPDIDDLARQLAQRFGIGTSNWTIKLVNNQTASNAVNKERTVGSFDIVKMEDTEIQFHEETNPDGSEKLPLSWRAFASNGNIRTDIEAGFTVDDVFYPVKGWVAYAKEPYRDDLMAGIRIYCNGKIAAQTSIFNRKAGFTGEHDVRSYLVGELHANWLDQGEDLIQTDRRDILWSHELGRAFEAWGQSVVLAVGRTARDPMKKRVWDEFRRVSRIEERITQTFPGDDNAPIRATALDLAKHIGKSMRSEEVKDLEQTESVVLLSLSLAPHIVLNEKLREAADEKTSPLAVMTEILKTAHLAELSSFGRIADDRLKVIAKIEDLKDDPTTLEDAFQTLIEQAPWLVNPQWSPITANQTFTTLKVEFQKFYKHKTGVDLVLSDFANGKSIKRADFVMSNQDNKIEIVEIKKPSHKFENAEMERLQNYVYIMDEFLRADANKEFLRVFNDYHITLVCDGEKLEGVHKQAFEGLRDSGKVTLINWTVFLLRTRRMHEAFLHEAERQQSLSVGKAST